MKSTSPQDKQLAEWRRKHGVWFATFVVEGFDDDYTRAAPGNLSKGFAERMMCMALAEELGCKCTDHVHLKRFWRET